MPIISISSIITSSAFSSSLVSSSTSSGGASSSKLIDSSMTSAVSVESVLRVIHPEYSFTSYKPSTYTLAPLSLAPEASTIGSSSTIQSHSLFTTTSGAIAEQLLKSSSTSAVPPASSASERVGISHSLDWSHTSSHRLSSTSITSDGARYPSSALLSMASTHHREPASSYNPLSTKGNSGQQGSSKYALLLYLSGLRI